MKFFGLIGINGLCFLDRKSLMIMMKKATKLSPDRLQIIFLEIDLVRPSRLSFYAA